MRNIELNAAYDEQTQELLIDQVIASSLTDPEMYDNDHQKQYLDFAREHDLVFNTESDLMRAVKNDFFGLYSDLLDEMSSKYSKIFMYMHVDYSQMLTECLMNGYIDLVKQDGKYIVYVINPAGFYEVEYA